MLRTEKIRRPDLLLKCGPSLLEKHRGKVMPAANTSLQMHVFSPFFPWKGGQRFSTRSMDDAATPVCSRFLYCL